MNCVKTPGASQLEPYAFLRTEDGIRLRYGFWP